MEAYWSVSCFQCKFIVHTSMFWHIDVKNIKFWFQIAWICLLFSFGSFELWNFINVIDDLMLFISFLDSTILSIGNVVYDDQKQHVLEA
jgi:hypothetical protein